MNVLFDKIADGIADNGFAIADQFLSQDEVNAIVALPDFARAFEDFKKAGIGKHAQQQINEAIRGDYIKWLDRTTAPASIAVYLDRLQELIVFLNRSLYLSLRDYEVHMTVYPAGSFYKRHLDQFKKDDRRKLSVICYLNNEWQPDEGGQLRMYTEQDAIDILPEAGRLVCFRSDLLEHEVLPATRERKSITGWILDEKRFV